MSKELEALEVFMNTFHGIITPSHELMDYSYNVLKQALQPQHITSDEIVKELSELEIGGFGGKWEYNKTLKSFMLMLPNEAYYGIHLIKIDGVEYISTTYGGICPLTTYK